MTDTKLQLIFAAKNLASGEVNRLHGGLVKLKGGFGGVVSGAKSAGGELGHLAKVGIFGLVGALGLAAGAIGFATKRAADEQVGIVRLDKALKDNVKGYDGNRAAIEKKIAAQEKLGFSDDDLRDSLGALVVKTKDITKAQQLQSMAMDLARARNIDLGTATDTLIKIQNGQYRALKGLGIAIVPVTKAQDALRTTNKHATDEQKKAAKALDDTATKALALAAIQKATAGQAKAYGDTQVGIFESIKITVGDVVEDLGGIFLPMLKGVSLFARDTVVPALSLVVTTVGAWIKANQPLIAQVGAFVGGVLKDAIGGVVAFGRAIFDALPTILKIGKTVYDIVVPKVQAFVTTMTGKGGVVDSVMGVVGPILQNLVPAFGKVIDVLFGKQGLVPALGDLVGVLWGDGKGPLAIAVKGIGGAFGWLLDNVVTPIISALKVLVDWAKLAFGWLDKLPKVAPPSGAAFGTGWFGQPAIMPAKKARGGPFPANSLMIVGEHSAESAMFATGAGHIIPDGGAAARQRGGGGPGAGPMMINVYLNGRKVHGALDSIEYYDLANQAPTLSRS